jgi:hypothetical protein
LLFQHFQGAYDKICPIGKNFSELEQLTWAATSTSALLTLGVQTIRQLRYARQSRRARERSARLAQIDLEDVHESIEYLRDQWRIAGEGLQAKPADEATDDVSIIRRLVT